MKRTSISHIESEKNSTRTLISFSTEGSSLTGSDKRYRGMMIPGPRVSRVPLDSRAIQRSFFMRRDRAARIHARTHREGRRRRRRRSRRANVSYRYRCQFSTAARLGQKLPGTRCPCYFFPGGLVRPAPPTGSHGRASRAITRTVPAP